MTLNENDFYYENNKIVFTRQFLLKRGYCCKNGCRHCPYKDLKLIKDQTTFSKKDD